MIDPIVAWYEANLNDDWEHTYGIDLWVSGSQEYLVKVDLNETVIASAWEHRERFGTQSGGWVRNGQLCCRGHWRDFAAASHWIGSKLKALLHEAAEESRHFMDILGTQTVLEVVDRKVAFEPILLEIVSLVCQDCGLESVDQVIVGCDDRGLFEVRAPVAPKSLQGLFELRGSSYIRYVTPSEVALERDHLRSLIAANITK